MKIKVQKTDFIEVEIDNREMEKIARQYIVDRSGLPYSYDWFEISDGGKLFGIIDHGGHGSGYVERVIIRDASELDKAAVTLLRF